MSGRSSARFEAVETAIWLIEVAPQLGKTGKRFLEHLADANNGANPELMRLALKLATGAGIMPPAGLCREDSESYYSGAVEPFVYAA
jgi:hypothetical protein